MNPSDRVFEADEILSVLSAHGVDFVVIGGIAVQTHGYIRSTHDLDIVVRARTLNLTRLSEALAELEAEPRGDTRINVNDPHQLRAAPLVAVTTRAGPLDMVNFDHLAGAPASYDALRDAALTVHLRGFAVAVAALRDLIRMKRAAGREHDLADIEALTRKPEST